MEHEQEEGLRLDRQVVLLVLNGLLLIGMAVVGFMVTLAKEELRELRARADATESSLSVLRERLPLEYVRMDLYVRDRQEIMNLLRDIDRNVREHREQANGIGLRLPKP